MKQRGRKSTSPTAVVARIAPVARALPEPPECLTEDEAAIWRHVVEAARLGWWREEYRDTLVAYCRHAAAANFWAGTARKERAKRKRDIDSIFKAERAHQLATAQMLSCARALRLTAQAQTRQRDGGGQVSKPPWEA